MKEFLIPARGQGVPVEEHQQVPVARLNDRIGMFEPGEEGARRAAHLPPALAVVFAAE